MLISETQATVICLQETMIGDRRVSAPRGFNIFHKLGPNPAHGGSAILVHNSRPFSEFPVITDLQAVAIQVHLNRKVTVCSIYMPPNENIDITQILDLIQQLPTPFMLIGDFNARHTLWGDNIINARARILERILLTENSSFLNTGSHTHCHLQTNSFTCIDLALCSTQILNDFEWKVSEDLNGSDHLPLLLTINNFNQVEQPIRFNFRRADWAKFKSSIFIPQKLCTSRRY